MLATKFDTTVDIDVVDAVGVVFDNPAKKMRVDAAQRTGAIEAYITTGSRGPIQRPNDAGRIAAGRQRPTASADGGAPSEYHQATRSS